MLLSSMDLSPGDRARASDVEQWQTVRSIQTVEEGWVRISWIGGGVVYARYDHMWQVLAQSHPPIDRPDIEE